MIQFQLAYICEESEKMIELEENSKKIKELKSKLNELGDSL